MCDKPRPGSTTISLFAGFALIALFAGFAVAANADELDGVNTDAAKPAHDDQGVITGTVTFTGEVPRATVADNAGQRRALLHVDRKSRGLQYAVGYLVTKSPHVESARPPAVDQRPREPVVIDQIENTFVPHVIAIRSGQTVKFTNSDTANHNVRGNSLNAKNEFNIFTGAGVEHSRPFFADRNRPVRLGCDIHPWMGAWVYAFDHPHYAVTDKRGKFRIENVPPGTYQLMVRQPDGGLSRKSTVMVEVGEAKHVRVEFGPDDLN